MIKAIFFDLYGTLAGFNPSRFEIQSSVASKYGLNLTEDAVSSGYAKADEFMSRQNSIRPIRSMDESERRKFFAEYERLILAYSYPNVSLKTAEAVWEDIQRISYQLTVFNDVRPVLKTLREQGLILAIISNMNITGKELLNNLDLSKHIDFAITSLEANSEKPDTHIFKVALRKAQCTPKEAIHVGDQILSDIIGAKRSGTHSVLIDRYSVNSSFKDAPRIKNLFELQEVIDKISCIEH